MKRRTAAAIIIVLLLIAAGCRKNNSNYQLTPSLFDYIPVNNGHSVIYDVDSIAFGYDNSAQVVNTVYYQLMEKVLDTFTGNNGNTCYRMGEYKRYDTTQPFPVNYQEWYCYLNYNTAGTSFIADQNDLPFVKFLWPAIQGVNWPGNEYLPTSDTNVDAYQIYSQPAPWVYTFTTANTPATINGHFFDSTAQVTAVNSQNLINSVVSVETYARHIGLVSRQWEVIDKQDPTSSWANPNQANGFRIFMWYHSYTP